MYAACETQRTTSLPSDPAPSRDATHPPSEVGPRVLMLSCAFPPTGGSGVQRSAKFAKYLPWFGWRPIVWSASRLQGLPTDQSLSDDLPSDLAHYHTRPLDHTSIHAGLSRLLRRLPLGGVWRRRILPRVEWRLERIARWAASHAFPDERIGWALFSLVPLLRLIRRERIDVIYSTYSPLSGHLLGSWLKRLTGLPWVSDYRDLWVDDCHYRRRGRLRSAVERRMQRKLLERADAVIGVTESQTDILAQYVPSERHKFHTIHNGVDLEDFYSIDPQEVQRVHGPKNTFIVTYTGHFSSLRVNRAVVEAWRRFAKWTRDRPARFELRIVGSISEGLRTELIEADIPLVTTGYVPHRQAIKQMLAADVLLLLTPSGLNSSTFVTAKTYEYLAAGRPILAVGSADSVAVRLVTECRAGIVTTPRMDAMLTALKRLWTQWQDGSLHSDCTPEQIRPYTRQHLTSELADVLNGVRPTRYGKSTAVLKERSLDRDAIGKPRPAAVEGVSNDAPTHSSAARTAETP